jgi:hypothetical protein
LSLLSRVQLVESRLIALRHGGLVQSPSHGGCGCEAAHLAALAEDPAEAKKYFLLTKGQVDVDQWQSKDQFENCYKWAFGL